MTTAPKYFQVTPPPGIGDPFFATYVVRDTGIAVFTTRESGKWKLDEKFKYEDLLSPQFAFNEWTINPISKEDAPPLSEGEPLIVDLLKMDMESGEPNWLNPMHPQSKHRQDARQKAFDKHRPK